MGCRMIKWFQIGLLGGSLGFSVSMFYPSSAHSNPLGVATGLGIAAASGLVLRAFLPVSIIPQYYPVLTTPVSFYQVDFQGNMYPGHYYQVHPPLIKISPELSRLLSSP